MEREKRQGIRRKERRRRALELLDQIEGKTTPRPLAPETPTGINNINIVGNTNSNAKTLTDTEQLRQGTQRPSQQNSKTR